MQLYNKHNVSKKISMNLIKYLNLLKKLDEFNNLIIKLKDNNVQEQFVSSMLCGSAKAYILAGLKAFVNKQFLIVCSTTDKAELLYENIGCFSRKGLFLFPDKEILPFEDKILPHPEIIGDRIEVLDNLNNNGMIVTSLRALLYKIPSSEQFNQAKIHISCGQEINRDELVHRLIQLGYDKTDMVESRGDVSYRGGIVDVFPVSVKFPFRIELFGDKVESIREFDPITQRSINILSEILLLPRDEDILSSKQGFVSLLDYFNPSAIVVFDESQDILENEASKLEEELLSLYQTAVNKDLPRIEQIFSTWQEMATKIFSRSTLYFGTGAQDNEGELSSLPSTNFGGQIKVFIEEVKKWQEDGLSIVLASSYQGQAERLEDILKEQEIDGQKSGIHIIVSSLSNGFQFPSLRLIIVTDSEIFGRSQRIRQRRFDHAESMPISNFTDLNIDDFVVHVNHGIGKYLGIVNIKAAGVTRDFLLIEYDNGDKIYVPLEQFGMIQKYIGNKDHPPKIHRLNDNTWEKTKKRVKKSIENMAKDLLELYAIRKALPGHKFRKDTLWQHEFEAGFIYEETPDQLKAVDDVKMDMEKETPMDRLVCGDVGYGKTEVALRAIFKTIVESKQVAVLVPTTILALQHFTNFQERLSNFPVKVEMLSRFRTHSEQKRIIADIKQGNVDIIIGTHRLLQKDITFKELGLVVVDEEQRFGVSHKEKLKNLRQSVDVLTLTATPIPRTLYMSLSGARDMSVINTPPPGRLSIKTLVLPFSEKVIREAILREMDRGGQIYFIHNRINTIYGVQEFLKQVVPQARVIVGHGQMHEHELEKVMADFLHYRYDILLSTSIIESGIDIPRVNTIIINNAHQFGLSQLYQLRGRVGRAKHQAYAYLLYPLKIALSREADERLSAISEFTSLGSGFKIAMRDLEIRGAGNILGAEQHGNMVLIGFELYCKMLSQAVSELKGEKLESVDFPVIGISCDAYLPVEYIPDLSQRFTIYKKVSACFSIKELQEIKEELIDRYGPIPEMTNHLLFISEIRIKAKEIGVVSVTTSRGTAFNSQRILIELPQKPELIPRIISVVKSYPKEVQLHPKKHNLLTIIWQDEKRDMTSRDMTPAMDMTPARGLELLKKILYDLASPLSQRLQK